jgi:outer membrane protein assembly factor BamB
VGTSAFAILVAVAVAAAAPSAPPVPAVPWSPAPPARTSLHFEGIWQSPVPLDRNTRVLFGDRLLGYAGNRVGTTDGLGFFLLDRDRGRVLERISAPGAQATVVRNGDDDVLVVWRRPGEVEEADKTPCGLAAYDPRRLRSLWRQKACGFLDAADDRRLAVAPAGKRLLLLAALHTSLASDADQPTALVAVAAATGRPVWRQKGPPRVGAVGGGGDRFYLAARDSVWALDPGTGRTLWRSPRATGADPAHASEPDLPVALTTTAAGDDLFVAAGNTVGRLDGANGISRWQRSLPGAGAIVQLVERQGTLFAVSYRDGFEGSLVALDAVTGDVRWAREIWQPAIIGVVPEGLLVTFTVDGSDHQLSVLDPSDGAALAQIDIGESFSGPSAIAGADGYLVARRGEALTGLRLRAGAEDGPPATARLAGAVEICYRRGCSRRAGFDVRVTGAERGAKAETVVTDAGGQFTVPLRRGRLVTASVDSADFRSVEEPLTRDALARDASLRALTGYVRCYGDAPATIVATRDGETVHVVLRIDCRVEVRD